MLTALRRVTILMTHAEEDHDDCDDHDAIDDDHDDHDDEHDDHDDHDDHDGRVAEEKGAAETRVQGAYRIQRSALIINDRSTPLHARITNGDSPSIMHDLVQGVKGVQVAYNMIQQTH